MQQPDSQASRPVVEKSSLNETLGLMWVGWYAVVQSQSCTPVLVLATLIFALLTTLALAWRGDRGAGVIPRFSVLFLLALILWLRLAWHAIHVGIDWPVDDESASPMVHAAALLARAALRLSLLGALFAYPLGRVFPPLKWAICFGVATSEAFVFWPLVFGSSASPWTSTALLTDLIGLAAGLPWLVQAVFSLVKGKAMASRRATAVPRLDERNPGMALDDEALRRTARDSGWLTEDPKDFRFLCETATPRWSAVPAQLREDFTHWSSLRMVLGGIVPICVGLFMHWPAATAFGFMVLGLYAWMLSMALRVNVAAPVRFGVVAALDGRHPFRQKLVFARALCEDGQVVRVVVAEALVREIVGAEGGALVAFLHSTRNEYCAVLAARAARAA